MRKRRIILSSLLGTVAISAIAVSVTLAWYGASNRLSVNYFDIDIAANDQLKLSLTGEENTFVEHLDKKDLNNLYDDFLFAPVSSMHKSRWMNPQNDMPIFYDSSNYLTPSDGIPRITEGVAGRDYFSRKIYLRSDLDKYVTLDPDACVFENDEDSNAKHAQALYDAFQDKHPEYNLTVTDIKDKLDNLLKCLRVSILVNVEGHYSYYIVDPKKEGTTTFGGLLDNSGDGYYDTYDQPVLGNNEVTHHFKETVYGEVNDREKIVYGGFETYPVTESYEPGLPDQFFGNSFEGKRRSDAELFNREASMKNGLEFATEESISLDDLRKDETLIQIPCYKKVATEIVISFYLEGWDLQCINATMGASFNTKLSFKLSKGIILN